MDPRCHRRCDSVRRVRNDRRDEGAGPRRPIRIGRNERAAGYTLAGLGCTAADGTAIAGVSPTSPTVALAIGANITCTFTNTEQPSNLTLVKVVDNGQTGASAVPGNWTLTATPVNITGQAPVTGAGNSPAVTNQTVFSGSYDLSESGGPAGFQPGTWSCTGGTLSGVRLTIPSGSTVSCTITNTAIAPTLTLVKSVVNDNGGSALATQWPLTAAGPETITGATGEDTITAATVPVGTYDLSEGTGPAGYAASAWVCTGATSSTADSVTIDAGQNATCTITNDDIAPQLTLVKTVTNDNGGTASETDWDLTATGPSTITGSTGDAAITDALVTAGSYTLSEAGPVGYAPGAWSCTGGAVSGAVVTVPVGADVTCTINNDDIEPLLTLVKTVDNGNTGGTATSDDWTLTADGPTPITGVSGAPEVTSANVTAGEYDLSESTGPAGYQLSALVCADANGPIETVSVADPTVSIAPWRCRDLYVHEHCGSCHFDAGEGCRQWRDRWYGGAGELDSRS